MKVIQIAVSNSTLYAITNTGHMFGHSDGEWISIDLPPGCVTGPPDLPFAQKWWQTAPIAVQEPELPAPTEVPDRKIDVATLPPKLRSVLGGEAQKNICPVCGMFLEGGKCTECSI